MPLSTTELEDLQAEYMADDIELTDEMSQWTEAQARVYFEHMIIPLPESEWEKWVPVPTPPRDVPPKLRMVCFPNSGTTASIFTSHRKGDFGGNPLMKAGPKLEVIAVELPGRGKRHNEEMFTSMDTLSDELCRVLLPTLAQPVPYVLVGHSVGTWIAYEVWRKLKAKGCVAPPRAFFVNSFLAPHVPESEWPWPRSQGTTVEERLREETLEQFKEGARMWGTPESALNGDDATLDKLIRPQMAHDFMLFDLYKYAGPEELPCPVYYAYGEQDPMIRPDLVKRWSEIAPEAHEHACPGGHLFMQDDEHRFKWMDWVVTMLTVNGELR